MRRDISPRRNVSLLQNPPPLPRNLTQRRQSVPPPSSRVGLEAPLPSIAPPITAIQLPQNPKEQKRILRQMLRQLNQTDQNPFESLPRGNAGRSQSQERGIVRDPAHDPNIESASNLSEQNTTDRGRAGGRHLLTITDIATRRHPRIDTGEARRDTDIGRERDRGLGRRTDHGRERGRGQAEDEDSDSYGDGAEGGEDPRIRGGDPQYTSSRTLVPPIASHSQQTNSNNYMDHQLRQMRRFVTEYVQPQKHLGEVRERMLEEMEEEGIEPAIIAAVVQEPAQDEAGAERKKYRQADPRFDTRISHRASTRPERLQQSQMPAVQMNVLLNHLVQHPPDSFNPSLFVLLPEGEEAIATREKGIQTHWPLVQEAILPIDDTEEEKKRCEMLNLLKRQTNWFAAILQTNAVGDGINTENYAIDGYFTSLNAFAQAEAERQSRRWGQAMVEERLRVRLASGASASSLTYKLAKRHKAQEAFLQTQTQHQSQTPTTTTTPNTTQPPASSPFPFFPTPSSNQTPTPTTTTTNTSTIPSFPPPPPPGLPATTGQHQIFQQQYDPVRGWQLVGIPANAGNVQGTYRGFRKRRFKSYREGGGGGNENFRGGGGTTFRGGGRGRNRGGAGRGRGGTSLLPLPTTAETV